MATTSVPYSSVLSLMVGPGINYIAGTAVAALCTSAYTPSQTGHSTFADIAPTEVADASYARATLLGKTQNYDSGTKTLTLAASDTTFSNLTASGVRYVIFGMVGASDALSPLLGYWDLGANQDAAVNDFVVVYNANGFLTIAL